MEMTLKKYLLITVPIIAIVIFAIAAYANLGGLGTKLAGVGGPFASGLYKVLIGPLNWAVAGGWPTLAILYLVGFIVIPFSFAFIIWHWDVPYKLQGAASPSSPASGYDNTMKREPEEPERSNTPITK